ncbi:putative membrane protein [Escherichia coli P0298942.1]|nr:putative membrane protein [Escherichia coli P0298942.1]
MRSCLAKIVIFKALLFIPTQTIISVILCAGITQHHIPADKIL